MKKIVLLLFLAGTFAGMAQKNNEFKIDVFDILALKSLDISYEHEMNADASMGIALLFNFEKTASNFRYNEEFVLTPYYRQYLFDRDNFTYYGEFYGALNMGEKEEEDYTDFAFGLGFGGKHISDNGLWWTSTLVSEEIYSIRIYLLKWFLEPESLLENVFNKPFL